MIINSIRFLKELACKNLLSMHNMCFASLTHCSFPSNICFDDNMCNGPYRHFAVHRATPSDKLSLWLVVLLYLVNFRDWGHLFCYLVILQIQNIRNVDQRVKTPIIKLNDLPKSLWDEVSNRCLISLAFLQFKHDFGDVFQSKLTLFTVNRLHLRD